MRQNWNAALDGAHSQEEAASLLACYGWASVYKDEFPRGETDNAFYTVGEKINKRHYNIVNDDIMLRFAAIEKEGRDNAASNIINSNMKYADKYNALDNLLFPRLWCRKDDTTLIRLGLAKQAYKDCETCIMKYIHALLRCGSKEEIQRLEIDKSGIDITFAPPQAFTISMDDMTFSEYTNKFTAEYNKVNAAKLGASRSKSIAEKNFEHVTGDEWTAKELDLLGIDKDKRPRLIKNGLIAHKLDDKGRKIRGLYERVAAQ